MNIATFQRAFAIADNSNEELSKEDISMFDGFGLREFQPVVSTVRQLAALLRWQAMYIGRKPNGDKWDMFELNNIKMALRYKLTVLN